VRNVLTQRVDRFSLISSIRVVSRTTRAVTTHKSPGRGLASRGTITSPAVPTPCCVPNGDPGGIEDCSSDGVDSTDTAVIRLVHARTGDY
jgi:hypothetical protein